jgi:FkbM family methyltransferase
MSIIGVLGQITRHPLCQSKKLPAIGRFLRWQLGSRLIGTDIVHEWVGGAKFYVRTGETGLTPNIYTGLQELPEMGYLLHVLRPSDLFVDVGANAGSFTLLACAVVGAHGIAFEPIPQTYRRLVENCHLNHLDTRVRLFNCGIGEAEGSLTFTCDSGPTNHVYVEADNKESTVVSPMTSLDLALRDESPALIKIDVEGYETSVLNGAKEILRKQTLHSVIAELNGSGRRYNFDEQPIIKMMMDLGFQSYAYDPLKRTLTKLNGKNLKSGNTLFVRDLGRVMENIKSSPAVLVNGLQI